MSDNAVFLEDLYRFNGEVSGGRGLKKAAEIPSVCVYENNLNNLY